MSDRHYAAAKRQRPGSMQLAADELLRPVKISGDGEWLTGLLGGLPDGFTQEQRDRNIAIIAGQAQVALGDGPAARVLLYKAARQCARFGTDGCGDGSRAVLLRMCGLLPYGTDYRRYRYGQKGEVA